MKYIIQLAVLGTLVIGASAIAGTHRHYTVSSGWVDSPKHQNRFHRHCRDKRLYKRRHSSFYHYRHEPPKRAHYRRNYQGSCLRVEYTRRGEVLVVVPRYYCY